MPQPLFCVQSKQTLGVKMMAENKAIIEHNSNCKYILAKVRTGQGTNLAIVSKDLEWHADIASTYSRELKKQEQSLESVLGGGRLEINNVEKTIKTYGHSGSYGKAPLDLVEKVLKENFPDYKLDIR